MLKHGVGSSHKTKSKKKNKAIIHRNKKESSKCKMYQEAGKFAECKTS
jgi:hypothetical protein